VLVVEDQIDLRQTLCDNLAAEGFSTCAAATAETALDRAGQAPLPDLIMLDLILPDRSGLEVCRSLRAEPRTEKIPVIMVTGKSDEIDRIVGFSVGADDYVVKPFSMRELMLRVRAVLRRTKRDDAGAPEILGGSVRIDPSAHRVRVDEQDVVLTALEFKLLVALAGGRGRVQTREHLIDHVWGHKAPVTSRTIDTHVKRLRRKLGPAGAQIETLRGVGYRFRA
jgi:two-component system phosphate regulon response regulator PhoB